MQVIGASGIPFKIVIHSTWIFLATLFFLQPSSQDNTNKLRQMPSSTAPAEIIVSIMAKYNAYLTERQVDAVLFDMDGTLVNSIAAVEAAWGAVADEIGQPRKSVIEVRSIRIFGSV